MKFRGDAMKDCDCFVGFLCGEQVTKSTIDNEVTGVESHQLSLKEYGLMNGEPQTKRQIFDDREMELCRKFADELIALLKANGYRF